MTGWLRFSAPLELLAMGRGSHGIVRLPDHVLSALPLDQTRRVEGEINAHPVNLAVTRMEGVGAFLHVGTTLARRIDARPGDLLEAQILPANPDAVQLPLDVAREIDRARLGEIWDALTPGRQRGLLYPIGLARTEATRKKRIAAVMIALEESEA